MPEIDIIIVGIYTLSMPRYGISAEKAEKGDCRRDTKGAVS